MCCNIARGERSLHTQFVLNLSDNSAHEIKSRTTQKQTQVIIYTKSYHNNLAFLSSPRTILSAILRRFSFFFVSVRVLRIWSRLQLKMLKFGKQNYTCTSCSTSFPPSTSTSRPLHDVETTWNSSEMVKMTWCQCGVNAELRRGRKHGGRVGKCRSHAEN